MKVRLTLVELPQFEQAKADKISPRYCNTVSKNWKTDGSLIGQVVTIRGTEYYGIDQRPAKRAVNAAKKHMDHKGFRRFAL